MSELVAENKELKKLSLTEELFAEGDIGEIRFYLDRALSESEVATIESELRQQGVTLIGPVVQEHGILAVGFQKAIAPLLLIALVVGTLGAGVLGWQVFKLSTGGVPTWVLLIAGMAVVYLMFRSKTTQVVIQTAATRALLKK